MLACGWDVGSIYSLHALTQQSVVMKTAELSLGGVNSLHKLECQRCFPFYPLGKQLDHTACPGL